MTHPMLNLPQSTYDARGGTSGRRRTQSSLDEGLASLASGLTESILPEVRPFPAIPLQTLAGHPCAAGCGHYCWATNGNFS